MPNRPMKEDPVFLIKFIRLIEKRPCLWNYTLKEYSKRDDIDLVWKSIAVEVNDTEQNCRDRWRNIRCAFVRSRKLSPNGKQKKAYYLAKHLSFLSPFTKGKISYTNCDDSLGDSAGKRAPRHFTQKNLDVLEVADDNSSESSISSPIKQEVIPKIVKLTPQRLSQPNVKSDPVAQKDDTKQSANEDDADLLFFRSLLPEVKKLEDKQKRTFKRKVMRLLDEFLDENESCAVATPLSTTSSVQSTSAWVPFGSLDG